MAFHFVRCVRCLMVAVCGVIVAGYSMECGVSLGVFAYGDDLAILVGLMEGRGFWSFFGVVWLIPL